MIYSVIVDISNNQVDRVFDYKSDNDYSVGQRVEVNFANRITEGYIVQKKHTSDYPLEKLKDIICAKDDYAAISEEMLNLGTFMQKKYHLRFIDVLRLFIPAEMRGNRVGALIKNQASLNAPYTTDKDCLLKAVGKRAEKQMQLAEYLFYNGATLCEVLNRQFSASALKSLAQKGIVRIESVIVKRSPYNGFQRESTAKLTLTDEQKFAVNAISKQPSGSFLLHGVTGSGKTEIYMTVIEHFVAAGKTCIMLVPEISLTPNVMRQFRNRFGDVVALLHSGLSIGERYDEWQRLKSGEARIAVGARSAIFAPVDNLGAIIIDEEHDSSYVSDFNPRYDTIEVAEYRRELNDCLLLLGSATPSLKTYYEAKQGKFQLLQLTERINKQPLPAVEIVDMASESRMGNKGIISQKLKERLTETIANGNQAILFINRRGYSSFLMCTKCGYVARCTDCDVTLTVHREDNELKCHYCKKRYKMLTHCPECHSQSFRQGKIGTQQVVELLGQMFPQVNVLRMDADTTQNKEGHVKILTAFAAREAQILVGTQMIAKGHDFPHVTLVGILDADQSLYYSDYLSAERTFQLLTQVAGRSGRNVDAGSVVLQTYTPTHYCLQLAAKQDYLAFYRREINLREASGFPPFALIVRILYQGEQEKNCIEQLTKHYLRIEQLKCAYADKFIYLDKMRSPLKRAEKKYRFQILMKLENDGAQEILEKIYQITDEREYTDLQVFVEQNPQSLT
ncbi:MAG: primosomal protein N' [Corallococcus sp.]|nr:primosomal protein N' [Corallococcus sp.]